MHPSFLGLLLVGCGGVPDGDSSPHGAGPVLADSPGTDSDTASVEDTDNGTPTAPSSCTFTADERSCPHSTVSLSTGVWGSRDLHLQRPLGTPPADGWPVAILFQGSFFRAAWMWEATPSEPFGAWYQTEVIGRLLDAGYAVVTPEAPLGGATYWTTNVPPYAVAWSTSPDHALMLALFDAIDDGTFPDVDPDRLYAGGISSGGYMTSRMAEAYPGRFRALAVHSASWCTCGGSLCLLPARLPGDHPPTLFLHGEQDAIAPPWAMRAYADQMAEEGLEQRVVTDPDAGHAWIRAAPTEIVDWFGAHP